jgi:hypothetical protein
MTAIKFLEVAKQISGDFSVAGTRYSLPVTFLPERRMA